MVIQRLDADPVASEHERTFDRVEDRKSKHAAESRQGVQPPLTVSFQQDLGIAASAKDSAEFLKFRAQRLEIVNLAVENYAVAAVGGMHRLRAALEIDDRQPGVPQRAAPPGIEPVVLRIGPAMCQRRGHGADSRRQVFRQTTAH